ncbi:MAG TPA: GIY-YIG nuclease family protein [Bacteroidia bacterium]|nr:GIY-YIG nuclease family protein [Bacteroidia bacterium]HRH09752.1 GIY-YIG nuclease family protein [Bacteroidia bacterium]HRH62917.1 GIY-YIG nuclease family protein [Bacteroidia bacterium]
MFIVYALYSKEFDKIYIGFTSNMDARFYSHNVAATKGYTVKYRPWIILYTEETESKAAATKREKELKSSKGRLFIRSLLH